MHRAPRYPAWHWQDPSPCLLPSPLHWPFPLQGRSDPPWHAVGTRARSERTQQAARARPSLSAHRQTAPWPPLKRGPLHAESSRLWGTEACQPGEGVWPASVKTRGQGAHTRSVGPHGTARTSPWPQAAGTSAKAGGRRLWPGRGPNLETCHSLQRSPGHPEREGATPCRTDGPLLLRAERCRGPGKAHPLHSGCWAGGWAGKDPQAVSCGSLGP